MTSEQRFENFETAHPDAYKLFLATVHEMRAERPGCKFSVSMIFEIMEYRVLTRQKRFLHVPKDLHRLYAFKAIKALDLPADA
jgi:hypothetical protein